MSMLTGKLIPLALHERTTEVILEALQRAMEITENEMHDSCVTAAERRESAFDLRMFAAARDELEAAMSKPEAS